MYIVRFLHQTTTQRRLYYPPPGCISFVSYIKPQPSSKTSATKIGCISFVSYIKPQLSSILLQRSIVVYRSFPTSNHNYESEMKTFYLLYIVRFLHQTTTQALNLANTYLLYIVRFLHQTTTPLIKTIYENSCISFVSYIKPQLVDKCVDNQYSCISFVSYIKPQLSGDLRLRRYGCISFVSYIKPQLDKLAYTFEKCCISFVSYIKPQHSSHGRCQKGVVYRSFPTSNHNSAHKDHL